MDLKESKRWEINAFTCNAGLLDTQRQKTYLLVIAPSADSDQPAHSCTDSQGCRVSSCGQRRLWSDCADAQADLSLRWAHMSEGVFLTSIRTMAMMVAVLILCWFNKWTSLRNIFLVSSFSIFLALVIACSNQSVYSAREGSLIFPIDLMVNSQFPDS